MPHPISINTEATKALDVYVTKSGAPLNSEQESQLFAALEIRRPPT